MARDSFPGCILKFISFCHRRQQGAQRGSLTAAGLPQPGARCCAAGRHCVLWPTLLAHACPFVLLPGGVFHGHVPIPHAGRSADQGSLPARGIPGNPVLPLSRPQSPWGPPGKDEGVPNG